MDSDRAPATAPTAAEAERVFSQMFRAAKLYQLGHAPDEIAGLMEEPVDEVEWMLTATRAR